MTVHAQEEATGDAAPAPVHHRVVKKKKPVTPAAPVPYTSLSPAMTKALTPSPPAPPMPASPVPADVPPPPPPLAMTPVPPSTRAPAPSGPVTEISLKCNTVTSNGRKTLTGGTFYIDLFPSPVFPDQEADFKFLLVDPQHASLVRDSFCLDMRCEANVSGSAYYLVNRRTKKGAALRITLNRADGAFYAEEINPQGLTHGGDHIGESGWCKPQKMPEALF